MEEELSELRRALTRLADRVAALERLQGGTVSPVSGPTAIAQRPSSEAVPPAEAAQVVVAGHEGEVVYWSAPPQEGTEAKGAASPPSIGGISIDWEHVLGRNWLAIVGAVALALGVGFFLRLAFENNWIGPTGRIILGIVTGLILLGIGEYAQRKYPTWAQAVTGGGIAILYLSTYAAFGFYKLIDPLLAFLFLALLVVVSGLLALRYESLVIALLSIMGAFLTPVLLGRKLEPGEQFLVLAYILAVDVGILGISTFRNWRWFTLVGMLASYSLAADIAADVKSADLISVQLWLTGIFLVFAGATTLFHIVWHRTPKPQDMALMTLNAVAYYGNTFGLLWGRYQEWFGLITLALSFFYGLVGYGAIRRRGAPPQVALYSLATALVFLTVAVPLQLGGSWITVAWAAEGAVLVWVGFVLRSWRTRAFGLAVFGIAAFRLLVFDTGLTPKQLESFRVFVNPRFPTFAFAIAASYVAAYLYWRERGRLEAWEEYMGLALAGAANLLTLWILSAEVIAFFDHREILARREGLAFQAIQDARNGRLLALTALWAIYAFGLLAIALARRSQVLRWAGLGLLAIPVLKLLLVDTFLVGLNPRTYLPILNWHFVSALVVLTAVVFAAYLYWRQRELLLPQERHVLSGLLVAANLVALWVLSMEAIRFFDSRETRMLANLASAKHLTLTVLWTVYAIGIITVGIARRSVPVRLGGMVLLAVPVAKLFVFDVFLLERGYRVAAFVILGVLLLATGLVYQRYSTAIRGFLFGKPA